MDKFSSSAGTAYPASIPDRTVSIKPARRGRYFFVAMAILFPILAVIGFTPSYQGMYSGAFKPHWFVHVHGALMTSWLAIFLTQAILAARGNLKFHRQLGQFSVVLGVLVWLCMGTASIRARIAFPPVLQDDVWDILLVELYAMNLFGLFFTWGILLRKNGAAHKRLLFLATLVLMQAAIDRTQWLPALSMYVKFIYLDALLIPLFIYDWLTLKRIHQMTLIGTACLIAVQLTVTMVWGSPAWHQFWYDRSTPFVERPVEIQLSTVQTEPVLGYYGNKDWKMTVSRAGSKLYLQLPGQPKWEMGATAENEFFLKTMTWKIIFEKGADGRVKKIVNQQGALTWEMPRIK